MSELWMGKGKENKGKRMRTGYIKVECLLMEKKGGAFILLVPVGLLYFSFALDLHLYFCLVFIFLFGFALLLSRITIFVKYNYLVIPLLLGSPTAG